MHEAFHILVGTLLSGIQITGLVIIMMLMIEYFNVQTHGGWALRLRKSGPGQVLLGAVLGIIPGCMGGFAAVSLYTHSLLGFGGLVAMMVASSGDEAFVMLAAIPRQALLLSVILFAVAVISGLIVNLFSRHDKMEPSCGHEFEMHAGDEHRHDATGRGDATRCCPHAGWSNLRHPSLQRIILLVSTAAFIAALAFGVLSHEHGGDGHHNEGRSINLLDEHWLNILFAVLSVFVLRFTATANEHFIQEHLWNHVIKRHLLRIFCWTSGTMLLINFGLEYFDIASFTRNNVPFMILLAVLIGIIPESGPHLLFVTMYAGGLVPFSVLMASSISQDGHASLPLLAESKSGFVKAKAINVAIALAAGFTACAMGF